MSLPVRAAPPRPVAKPGQVKVVKAKYKYVAQQPDELSFDEGDTLYIMDKSEPGWWNAKCGNRVGLIPENYVEESTEEVLNPLHEASKRGNTDAIRECLHNRVSVNGLDKSHSTALYWASHAGHADCVHMLLQAKNVQVNTQNKLGDTALHAAAYKGHADVVQMLIDTGADVAIKNNEKKTAMDLTKDVQSQAILRHASTSARLYSGEYGEEEDSD